MVEASLFIHLLEPGRESRAFLMGRCGEGRAEGTPRLWQGALGEEESRPGCRAASPVLPLHASCLGRLASSPPQEPEMLWTVLRLTRRVVSAPRPAEAGLGPASRASLAPPTGPRLVPARPTPVSQSCPHLNCLDLSSLD